MIGEHRPARVQHGAVPVQRGRGELHAIGLAREQRAQAALHQVRRLERALRDGRGGEEVPVDLVHRQLAVPPASGDDREQIRIRDVTNHQHVGVHEHARIEQRRRQHRSAHHADVGKLAQRAAGLAGAVYGDAFVDRLGGADVRDQDPGPVRGGGGRRIGGGHGRRGW